MEHTKEPWAVREIELYEGGGGIEIAGADGDTVADNQTYYPKAITEANARRIVAAINYCQGLPTKGMEVATSLGKTAEVSLQQFVDTTELCDQLQQQLTTERASLFAESQRKQQLEQQVCTLLGALELLLCDVEEAEYMTGREREAEARAVIQKVRGGE